MRQATLKLLSVVFSVYFLLFLRPSGEIVERKEYVSKEACEKARSHSVVWDNGRGAYDRANTKCVPAY